jgi:hypothetical protein
MCFAIEINHVRPRIFGGCFLLRGRIVRACIIHHQINKCNVCLVLLRTNSVLLVSRMG